jgi:hypothetical protein
MRDMKKRPISEGEDHAKTLLCIQRKTELANVHDNQIWDAHGGEKQI